MLAEIQLSDAVLVAFIAMFPIFMASLFGFIVTMRTMSKVDAAVSKVDVVEVKVDKVKDAVEEVHKEVKTANAQTLAQLSDAQESRRIEKILPKNRTEVEEAHIQTVDVGKTREGDKEEDNKGAKVRKS